MLRFTLIVVGSVYLFDTSKEPNIQQLKDSLEELLPASDSQRNYHNNTTSRRFSDYVYDWVRSIHFEKETILVVKHAANVLLGG